MTMVQDVKMVQTLEICFPRLPLAIYIEIAAHLRQVSGVQAGLLPQTSTVFDYVDSQVGGLWLKYSQDNETLVRQILSFYSDRYGAYRNV